MFLKQLVCLFYFVLVSLAEDWTYYDQVSWADSCGGTRQSPINIDTNKLKLNPMKLTLFNYNLLRRNLILHNTGHTAEITLDPKDVQPYIVGSVVGNGNVYLFKNLHFHWGNNNQKGSEHSLDGYFGAAELHFVHYNKKYGSYFNATSKPDGIVVLSVVANLVTANNLALDPIIRSLPQVRSYNSSFTMPSYNFAAIFPYDLLTFFRYPGSFTTPPCSEIVTWIIYDEPITISPLQLSQFRLLSMNNVDPLKKILFNNRNIQPLNGRVVEVSR